MHRTARRRTPTGSELMWALSAVGLMLLILSIAAGAAEETQAMAPPTQELSRPFLVGGDISGLDLLERHGAVYRDDGTDGDAVAILRDKGHNCFRLRLFVSPTGKNLVVNDLDYTVRLAKRIKASGAAFLLDFHYSDTWADPGQQTKPAAWESLEGAALAEAVQRYTRDCIGRFRRESVLPDYVQIGNEITPGMLWPDGKLHGVGDPDTQWDTFARLLKAGVAGVREGAGDDTAPRIVLHIDKGGKWQAVRWFFGRVERQAIPYDVIGLSYYPWWHGSLDDVRRAVWGAARTFGKDVLVAETAYPWREMKVKTRSERENLAYPATPVGQAQFARDLVRVVRTAPGGRGLGVLWWYPEAVRVPGLHIWNGGSTALFDADGHVLPAAVAMADLSD